MADREATCILDFESRSACSLKKCGAWKYSLDPTTEVLCLAFRLPYWEEGRTGLWDHNKSAGNILRCWNCGTGLKRGNLVEAHNAWFERSIWTNVYFPRYLGWPSFAHDQWRCSAAKAAAHALPRGLDDALEALKLPIRKDAAGAKVMMKMNKPRKPRKAEREAGVTGLLWWDTPELREKLYAYCRQDVLAEEALSNALPDLSGTETEMYLLDQAINERGFQLDVEAVSTALTLIAKETSRLNQELQELTNGQVKKATQRAQLQGWLQAEEDVYLGDTQKIPLSPFLLMSTLPEAALDRFLERSSNLAAVLQLNMTRCGTGWMMSEASTRRLVVSRRNDRTVVWRWCPTSQLPPRGRKRPRTKTRSGRS
jgi:DNA polymerase